MFFSLSASMRAQFVFDGFFICLRSCCLSQRDEPNNTRFAFGKDGDPGKAGGSGQFKLAFRAEDAGTQQGRFTLPDVKTKTKLACILGPKGEFELTSLHPPGASRAG